MTTQNPLSTAFATAKGLSGFRQDRQRETAETNRQGMLAQENEYVMQQREQQAQSAQALGQLKTQYGETGDPEVMRKIIMADPEFSSKIQKQFGAIDTATTNQAMNEAGALKQMLETNPDEAMAYWQQNLAQNQAFAGLADNFEAGDIEGAINEIGWGVTALGGQDAYDSLFGSPDDASIGTYNPRDYTVESFANFVSGGKRDPSVLEKTRVKPVMINDVPYLPSPDGSYKPVSVISGTGEDEITTEITPKVVSEQAASAAAAKAKAETQAKERVKQNAIIIGEGRSQARSIPTIKQTIALLDRVQTGGWTNELRNAAKRTFGVESADEGVLTANLGKAVLSQLRQTFGAAFTAREGEGLAKIEAGFNKSPETNKVLLTQLLQLAEKDVRMAITRATDAGDDTTVKELEDLMEFQFDLGSSAPEQDQAVAGPTVVYQEGQTATGPNGAKMIFQSGGWVAQ